jgi:cytochrome c-type biogenesis protein CcmF
MIGEIGFFFLVLVLVISGFGGGYLLTNYPRNNFLNQTEMQKKITELTFIFALLSFFCLTFSFLISDFSFEVVEKNSNSQLP